MNVTVTPATPRLTVAVTVAPVTHRLPSGRVLTLDLRLTTGWRIVDARYNMSGGYYGESSISADAHITSEERLAAHWAGYIEVNTAHDRKVAAPLAPPPGSPAARLAAKQAKVAKLVAKAKALPKSLLLKGPRGLTVSLKACEVFPEDPGNGCPAIVALPFGRASATYDCATDVGYLAGGRGNGFTDVDLSDVQKEWLEEVRPVVDTFVDGWFKRVEADPSARPAR